VKGFLFRTRTIWDSPLCAKDNRDKTVDEEDTREAVKRYGFFIQSVSQGASQTKEAQSMA
jgi:hypothetical protein